jgi:Mn2+/Fe2+ NRAMP family transporter
MVSAAGSGELLFTPRIGALYGYALAWALVVAVGLKWLVNREIGRYAVCTGTSILEGFARLPGPRNWAIWIIVVPQLLVAVATIAGLAGSAATALVLVLPGDPRWWAAASILVATALVVRGRYRAIEAVAMVLACSLGLASIVAASTVLDDPVEVAGGLVPQVPRDLDLGEVLPWLGFILSGAAGMIWYSYWIKARGYGAARAVRTGGPPLDPARLGAEDRAHLRGWISQMTLDNTVAVVGTLIVTAAFLILGAELLRPRGLVPEDESVAPTLGRLLGEVWGPIGFWFMVLAVFVGFWDTVLSDQDGFGRMFANGARLLVPRRARRLGDEQALRRVTVVVVTTLLPMALYVAVGKPVTLLKLAGLVEGAHIPVLTALTLAVNRRTLPGELQPSIPVFGMTSLAGLVFAALAVGYFLDLGEVG